VGGYDTVLAALESRELLVPGWGESKAALCPAHDDTLPSLSLAEGEDGRALLMCHAGCDVREVVAALDLTMSDLFQGSDSGAVVASYVYRDEGGSPLYRVLRLSPKGFFQERMEDGEYKPGMRDVRRVLYRLPELCVARRNDATVYVVEGEKDADNLAAKYPELCVTTLLGGANKWRDEYLPFFEKADVVIISDKDDAGRLHAETLLTKLLPVAGSVTCLVPAHGKDVTDHLLAGFGLEDLVLEGDGLDEFGPLDWESYEVGEIEWLFEPYIPAGSRVLAFGPAGSLKSLWAMWVAVKLAKEGKRVAYFSLEMTPTDTARRLRQLSPPKDNFLVFTKDLRLGSESHTNKLIAGLNGFDLIVIDSWSAARSSAGYETNEDVARLDAEVFIPLINLTGAALLILDNTGHDMNTETGKIKADHARGASAKHDKMEVALWFRRPFEDNNYRTTISFRKMRLDYPMPRPLTVETPREIIEFHEVEQSGLKGRPHWRGEPMVQEETVLVTEAPSAESTEPSDEMTPAEKRALARVKDKFKVMETAESVGDERD
jgi:hypothetical protein